MSKKYKRYLQIGMTLLIIGALVVGVIKYVNGPELFRALQSFNYIYALPMLGVSILTLLVMAWRFVVLVRPLGDVAWQVPFKVFIAGQPGLLIPGGLAMRAALLKQAGISVGKGSAPVLFSSLLDQASFFVVSLVAALWFPPVRLPVLIILVVVGLLAGAMAISSTRRWLARGANWLAQKAHIDEQWQQFQEEFPKLLTLSTMNVAAALTAVVLVLNVFVLDLDVRAFGSSLAYSALILSFVVPTMLGRLAPVPGGIGVTEASMVGLLVSTTELGVNAATAIVVIYRIATLFFQAVVGALVYFFVWRGNREEATAKAAG